MRIFNRTRQTNSKYISVLAAIVLCGSVGIVFLLTSHAATPTASVEAESGAVSSAASTVADSAASNGQAIEFGSGSTITGCSGAANTPGGADTWGGCFPGPNNTGVPAGTALTNYTGPCTITTANTTIDAKTINCDIIVSASGLTITRSKINGHVDNVNSGGTFSITDSEIDGGSDEIANVRYRNMTLLRDNIHGAKDGLGCDSNCLIQDSWVHNLYDGSGQSWHQQAVITNGGSGITIRHDSLYCTGGCTADVSLIPDSSISNVTLDKSLIVASPDSGYCLYGGGNGGNKSGTADHIVFTNNIIQRGSNGKCGYYGAIVYWVSGGAGDTWINNKWDDGTTLSP